MNRSSRSWNDAEWSITSFTAACAECERPFEEGDEYYSALSSTAHTEPDESTTAPDQPEDEGGDETEPENEEEGAEEESQEDGLAYERLDYCPSCWERNDPDVFSFWKTEVPPSDDEDTGPDRSTLAGLWRGLLDARDTAEKKPGESDEDDRNRTVELLYLLTLMLMRKGFLALEDEFRHDGRKVVRVRVRGTEDESYDVHEPEITEQQIDQVKTDLADLLDVDEEA